MRVNQSIHQGNPRRGWVTGCEGDEGAIAFGFTRSRSHWTVIAEGRRLLGSMWLFQALISVLTFMATDIETHSPLAQLNPSALGA